MSADTAARTDGTPAQHIEVDGRAMRLVPVTEAGNRAAVMPIGWATALPTLDVDTLLGGYVSLRWDVEDPATPPHAYTIFAATEQVYVDA